MTKPYTLTLADGRRLSYALYGNPNGIPVVMLHGNPGSRLSWGDLPGSPFRDDIRIIAPDRLGYGRSHLGRDALSQWPDDFCALLDHLEVGQALLFAPSGGAPYALASAWKSPERIGEVVLFGPVGPNLPDATKGVLSSLRLLWRVAGPLSRIIRLQMRIFAHLARRNPQRLLKLIRDVELTEADRVIFDRPELQRMFVREFREAYCQNGVGSAYDAKLPARWPIPLGEISTPVTIWHAANDQLVGNMPPFLHAALPNSTLHNIPNQGHLWVLNHVKDILDDVIERHAKRSKTNHIQMGTAT